MREPFPVVCLLGDRLRKERTGWRDMKALVLLVAQEGDWTGAAALAEALGLSPDQTESIYRDIETGGATPAPFPSRKQPTST